jgi:hypothetical protein
VVCTADDWTGVVTILFESEREPANDLDRFAARLKDLTIQGFATSDVGLNFGYTGNTAFATFRGCDHPDHQPRLAGLEPATLGLEGVHPAELVLCCPTAVSNPAESAPRWSRPRALPTRPWARPVSDAGRRSSVWLRSHIPMLRSTRSPIAMRLTHGPGCLNFG